MILVEMNMTMPVTNSNENKYQTSTSNSTLCNSDFHSIDAFFAEKGWSRVDNTPAQVAYSKLGHVTEYFQVTIKDKPSFVMVTIPLKSIPYHYSTKFTTVDDELLNYIRKRFADFVDTSAYH